jgi:hypothetical protein
MAFSARLIIECNLFRLEIQVGIILFIMKIIL